MHRWPPRPHQQLMSHRPGTGLIPRTILGQCGPVHTPRPGFKLQPGPGYIVSGRLFLLDTILFQLYEQVDS